MMYGILDCDNCYCSCEKVFRPDLEGQPIPFSLPTMNYMEN